MITAINSDRLYLHKIDNYISPAEQEKLNSFILSHVGPIALSLGTWTGINGYERGNWPLDTTNLITSGSRLDIYDVLLEPPNLLVSFFSYPNYDGRGDGLIIRAVVHEKV